MYTRETNIYKMVTLRNTGSLASQGNRVLRLIAAGDMANRSQAKVLRRHRGAAARRESLASQGSAATSRHGVLQENCLAKVHSASDP